MKKKIFYISFVAIIVLTIILYANSAYNKNTSDKTLVSSQSKSSKSKVPELTTITWYTNQRDNIEVEGISKNIIQPFEKKFPNIKVKHIPTNGWNHTLKVQIASGDSPDILDLDGSTSAIDFHKYGRLYDLTPYVKKYNWDKIIFPWALNSCRIDGKIFSIPESYEGLVLWYNEDLFTKYKWQIPQDREDLEAIAKDAVKKGIIPFAFGSSNFKSANEWLISLVLSEYAGPDNVKKVLTGELRWNDEPIIGAINTLVQMWDAGWINNKKSQYTSTDDSQILFLQGKAAMKMEGTWFFGQFESKNPEIKYNVSTFPSLRQEVKSNIPIAVGSVSAVSAKTKSIDEVVKFINFILTNPALHAQGIEKYGFQTLPIEYDEDMFSQNMKPVQRNMIKLISDASKSGNFGYCSWTFWPPETRTYMINNLQAVFYKKLSVENYLKHTQELFDKEKAAGKVPVIP